MSTEYVRIQALFSIGKCVVHSSLTGSLEGVSQQGAAVVVKLGGITGHLQDIAQATLIKPT